MVASSADACEFVCINDQVCSQFVYDPISESCTLYDTYILFENLIPSIYSVTGYCNRTPFPSTSPSNSPSATEPSLSPTSNSPTDFPSSEPSVTCPTTKPSSTPSSSLPSTSPSSSPTVSLPSRGPSANPSTSTPTVIPTF